ncbi:hypothetical protein WBG99_17410 [Streptomyces sp. TG1A-60]|uniref:hypothetical protein n=1 Tax=Streptomyces sp. TG1A-60 TaxID=3129111 RepID=UPI0030CDA8D4
MTKRASVLDGIHVTGTQRCPGAVPLLVARRAAGLWLEHIVEPEREHNTDVKYESKVRLYLLPHLGKKPLVKLTPAQIRTFMATLKREKVGAAARFKVLRVLRNALNRPIREEILTRNVALLVDMPEVSKDKERQGVERT